MSHSNEDISKYLLYLYVTLSKHIGIHTNEMNSLRDCCYGKENSTINKQISDRYFFTRDVYAIEINRVYGIDVLTIDQYIRDITIEILLGE